MGWYDATSVLVNLYESELERIEVNENQWRSRAIASYVDNLGFVFNLEPLCRSERQKHYAIRLISDQEVIELSGKKQEGVFYPRIQDHLPLLFDEVLAQEWFEIVTTRPSHVFFINEGDVGGSKGYATNVIRFDIDYSTPEVHCHPRPIEEVSSGVITYAEDYLAPTLKDYKERHYDRDDPTIDDPDEELKNTFFTND